ncbi:unnamed protein product [Microthlaspi erraticum]|uniref:Uncharacterized protein n=1 Tax=Microthlaspi erraticum TaxID=1685480 RepID=A0A6D2HN38_9BRAS|nr:unnamed protein product [Microthlaspi erraticum]
MSKIPEKEIVTGVNDTFSRIGWVSLALLCVYGAVKAVRAMEIDDHVGYKYLGKAVVFFYLIDILKSIFSETPSPVFKADRWVRTFVPSIPFLIIFFTIYNF